LRSSNSHFDFPHSCELGGRLSRWDWRRLGEGEREEQVFPGWKDQERGDARKLAEEVVARPELGARGAPEFVGDVTNRVDGEGQ
jgi:SLT domain-containing protein